MRKVLIILSLFLLVPFIGIAQDEVAEKKISLDAAFTFELGQVVKGRYNEKGNRETYAHLWLDNVCGSINLTGRPLNWLQLLFGFEGRMWYNNYPVYMQKDPNRPWRPFYSFYIHEAQGIFSVIKDKPIGLEFAFGIFPYKYNSEVRDLGEYLFRTGTYPIYFINYTVMTTLNL